METLPKNLSCGVVVVRREHDEWRFLLLRAWRHWDFPKGMREGDETPLQAAIREVREETLIEDLSFDWGEQYFDTGPYSRNKVARYFIACTETEPVTLPVNEEMGEPEHHEYRWVDLRTAHELVTARVASVLEWAEPKLRR